MTSQRLNEYFAGEAADYLDQLDGLLAEPAGPEVGRFLRLATGVRGSMQMAGAEAISRLAGRLEEAAGALAGSRLRWSDEIREIARRTVSDIRLLISALERWGPEEERHVRSAIERWDGFGQPEGEQHDERPVVAIDLLFYDDEGPHILEPSDLSADAVPIEDLVFRGDDALREALTLRPAFDALARGDAIPERQLADLVHEVFDLIELGLSSTAREE
jgi:hypothetical protein